MECGSRIKKDLDLLMCLILSAFRTNRKSHDALARIRARKYGMCNSKPNEVLGLNGKEFCCPYCDEAIELIPRDKDETTYCLHCGQALDWSDVK